MLKGVGGARRQRDQLAHGVGPGQVAFRGAPLRVDSQQDFLHKRPLAKALEDVHECRTPKRVQACVLARARCAELLGARREGVQPHPRLLRDKVAVDNRIVQVRLLECVAPRHECMREKRMLHRRPPPPECRGRRCVCAVRYVLFRQCGD